MNLLEDNYELLEIIFVIFELLYEVLDCPELPEKWGNTGRLYTILGKKFYYYSSYRWIIFLFFKKLLMLKIQFFVKLC